MRASLSALAALKQRAEADAQLAPLAAALKNPRVTELLAGIFNGSPFLAALIERDPLRLEHILTTAPEARLAELKAELAADLKSAETRADAMRALRQFKNEVALLTALADLAGVWPVLTVTGALTECADAALHGAVDFLFREAAARGQWLAEPDGSVAPERLHRARHGQVRRRGAQLFQRHRSHRLLRPRSHPHRAGRRAAGLLRAPDARPRADDVRAHRRRLRLPHRPAAAPRPRRDADRPVDHRGAHLLRELRTELGARGADQGARLRRRHRGRRGAARASWRRSSGASTSTTPPSPTCTR